MSSKSRASEQIIFLSEGGGALYRIGEKFTPDLRTGTGNFTVPIALPRGRKGFQPGLNLVYTNGNGNFRFGEGWSQGIPGITRRTNKSAPQYRDAEDSDIFVLSGSEDPVPVTGPGKRRRYRPRTEGPFARIERIYDPDNGDDFWEVCTRDGLISTYGTPGKSRSPDPAGITRDKRDKFAWKLTETWDTFGNRIVYARDRGQDGPRDWDQPVLDRIEYAEYRSAYRFTHANGRANDVSQLTAANVVGYDDAGQPLQELPPLTFGYTIFDPARAGRRDLIPIAGSDLPPATSAGRNVSLSI